MPVLSGIRSFLLGALIASLLIGCAAFKYRYYYIEMASYNGTLIGSKPEFDVSLELCQPTEQDNRPCVIMFREEFYRLKLDYKRMAIELQECQRD